MKFKIFDYASTEVEVEAPFEMKDIFAIVVTVLSGDETVDIITKDGDVYTYDASGSKFIDYYDGSYILTEPNKIQEWFEYEASEEGVTLSYDRQRKFE